MAFIWLVRHGSTDLIGKQLCGDLPGIHLNEAGRLQAQSTAAYLSRHPLKSLWSSPIERALETAQAIASRHGLPIQQVDFLREIDFGDLQGLEAPALRQHSVWQGFINEPASIRFPGGENLAEAQKRVAEGLDELAARHEDTDQIACVAHCEVLRLAICHAIRLPLNNLHSLTIDPASVSKLEWSPGRKKLHLLNWRPD